MGCKGLRGERPQLRRPERLLDVAEGSASYPTFLFSPPRLPPSALDFCRVICVWARKRGMGTTEGGASAHPHPHPAARLGRPLLLQTEETSKNGQ